MSWIIEPSKRKPSAACPTSTAAPRYLLFYSLKKRDSIAIACRVASRSKEILSTMRYKLPFMILLSGPFCAGLSVVALSVAAQYAAGQSVPGQYPPDQSVLTTAEMETQAAQAAGQPASTDGAAQAPLQDQVPLGRDRAPAQMLQSLPSPVEQRGPAIGPHQDCRPAENKVGI